MQSVSLRGVRKSYGTRLVLDLDRFEIAAGEFFVLIGPSGGGKTTLLRILAGLIRPDEGEVWMEGRQVSELAPHKRNLGVVFQGLALWPHLSVRGNLALGLDRVIADPAARAERIDATAAELKIDRFLKRRPAQLSGGERQRVAIARALVRRPALLLMDEAFSDLDARLRRSTARLVRRLHDEHSMTTLFITHDRTDAFLLADRIGVLLSGRLLAEGPPDRLHASPGSAFTAEFLSDAALLPGEVVGDGTVRTALGTLPLAGESSGSILVAVRPDEIRLGQGPLKGTVIACEFAGGPWRCRLRVNGQEVGAFSGQSRKAGEQVCLTAPSAPRRALEENR